MHPSHRSDTLVFHPARAPKNILARSSLDVLIADHSSVTQLTLVFGADHGQALDWHEWLAECPASARPKVIIQMWPAWTLWRDPGPTSNHSRKPLEHLGYDL